MNTPAATTATELSTSAYRRCTSTFVLRRSAHREQVFEVFDLLHRLLHHALEGEDAGGLGVEAAQRRLPHRREDEREADRHRVLELHRVVALGEEPVDFARLELLAGELHRLDRLDRVEEAVNVVPA